MDLYDELRILYVNRLLSYVCPAASYDCCVTVLDLVNVGVAGSVEATSRHVRLARIVVNTRAVDL